MGRDNAIPGRFFAAVNPRTRIPSNNIMLVGVITLAGAFAMSYSLGAELLNFGALIAFMGVNASAFVHYFLRSQRRTVWNLLPPLLGFSVCLYLWLSLGGESEAGRLGLAGGRRALRSVANGILHETDPVRDRQRRRAFVLRMKSGLNPRATSGQRHAFDRRPQNHQRTSRSCGL